MIDLKHLLLAGGVFHFCILIASALVPQVLDWRRELQKLPRLFAQLVWVHGGFIVLTIVGFGVVTIANAGALASGEFLARTICGFVALFWGARLAIQLFCFTPKEYLRSRLLKLGYHALTVVFAFLTIVYGWAAVAPHCH